MNPAALLIVTAALGIDVGWEPLADGGTEYIIQIEPELLDTLKNGQDLTSEVPPQLDVRRYRITVGNEPLPREMPRRPAALEPEPDPAASAGNVDDTTAADGAMVTDDTDGGDGFDMEPQPAADPFPTDNDAFVERESPTPALPAGDDDPFQKAAPPEEFDPDPQSSQIDGQQAKFDAVVGGSPKAQQVKKPAAEPTAEGAKGKKTSATKTSAAKPDESRPWWALTFSLLALFASLGGNVYLGWLAWTQRSKYWSMVQKLTAMPSTV